MRHLVSLSLLGSLALGGGMVVGTAPAGAQAVAASTAVNSSALINQALDQQVALDLNAPLPAAMDQIAKQTGVRLEADPAVWDLLPWGQLTNITAKIQNQTLRQALKAITQKLGLTFELQDEALRIKPMPALRRLGRRATVQELAALDLLASTPANLSPQAQPVRQYINAIDQRLVEIKAPVAVENRMGTTPAGLAVQAARNATLLDALDALPRQTDLTWYPWGKSLVIVSKEDQIRMQLGKTITTRYNGADVQQVLTELSQRAGVNFEIEPGALQRIAPEFRNIRLILDNTTIRQALETIAGFTGLGYVVNDKGVYLWNPSKGSARGGSGSRIVGLIQLPDLGIEVPVRESDVPYDLREYIQSKSKKELDKMREMMKEEGFKPATRPAGNEDL
jgi:hypothetical protein